MLRKNFMWRTGNLSLKFLLFSTIVSLFFFIAGCDILNKIIGSNSPEPEPRSDYHVYYHNDVNNFDDPYNIYTRIYSTGTLEPVDTIITPYTTAWGDLRFTSDGKYMIFSQNLTSQGIIRMSLVEYATGDTISQIDGLKNYLMRVSPDNNYLLTFGPYAPQEIYSIPDFNLIWRDSTVTPFGMEFLNKPGKFLRTIQNDTFFVVNFLSDPSVVDKYFANVKDDSVGLELRSLGIDRTNNLIYSVVYHSITGSLLLDVRNADDFSIVSQLPNPGGYRLSSNAISRSGELVFLYQTCSEGIPGNIIQYHPRTKIFTDYLNTDDISEPIFFPDEITITPDEKTMALIINRNSCTLYHGWDPTGDLMLIDIGSKHVIKNFTHKGGSPLYLRIYPIEK